METQQNAVAQGAPKQRLEFAYDHQGRRTVKKVFNWAPTPGTWLLQSSLLFLYDGWNLVAEFSLSQITNPQIIDLRRTYTWGLDLSGTLQGAGGLLSVSQISNTSFPIYDGNVNVTEYLNTAGTLAAHYEYSPFGETVRAQITDPSLSNQPFGFSTKYTDVETSLCYYGFRYYQPTTGRWLNRDPLEEQGSVNLYAFVDNSPLNFIDPLGLQSALAAPPALWAEFGVGIGAPTAGTVATTIAVGTGTTAVIVHVTKEGDKDDAPAVPIPIVKEQCPKDPCKQLENRLNEHIDKLGKYKANPDAFDNNNYPKNNPSLRDRIINGRIRHLENEIENFQRLLENCRKNNPR